MLPKSIWFENKNKTILNWKLAIHLNYNTHKNISANNFVANYNLYALQFRKACTRRAPVKINVETFLIENST